MLRRGTLCFGKCCMRLWFTQETAFWMKTSCHVASSRRWWRYSSGAAGATFRANRQKQIFIDLSFWSNWFKKYPSIKINCFDGISFLYWFQCNNFQSWNRLIKVVMFLGKPAILTCDFRYCFVKPTQAILSRFVFISRTVTAWISWFKKR